MAPIRKLIYFALVLVLSVPLIFSGRFLKDTDRTRYDSLPKHRGYAFGERIPLFVNTVFGADDQRCEASEYFSLPFCPPGEKIPNRKKSLNEILAGDCTTNTQYELKFGVSESDGFLCKKHLTKDDLRKFKSRIGDKSEYQMYFDKYGLRSKLGEAVEEKGIGQKFYLFNHIEFNVDFMDDRVMGINIVNSLDSSVDITHVTETEVEFSYSVFWNDIKLKNNSNYYTSRDDTAAEKTSWLTEEYTLLVLKSFWLWTAITFWWIALLLVVSSPYTLPYIIKNRHRCRLGTRRLNNRATSICHCPRFTSLLGAILSVGLQHLFIIVLLFVSAYEGIYPCNHEIISFDLVLIYCLTLVLAGLGAKSFHGKFTTVGWKECIFQTGALYILPVLSSVLLVKMFVTSNVIVDRAVHILSTAGVGSAILMSLSILIMHFHGPAYGSSTCVTRSYVQSSVGSRSWYMKTPVQLIIGGLLPFLPIMFQMDDIYASLWGMKVCGSLFNLLVAFVLVTSTTILTGFVYTANQILEDDWHWWWRSVVRGGSPALYMFVYGVYFISKIRSESYMELLPVLVYNGCICYSFFFVLGTIGFGGSRMAVISYTLGIIKKRS